MHSISIPKKLHSSNRLRWTRQKLHAWAHHATYNIAHFPQRILRGKAIHTYWYNAVTNFGDAITPVLLSHYGFTPIYVTPKRAQLVSTGSILHQVPDDFSGYILGSGLISEKVARRYPHATILALRGVLSRDLIQASQNTFLGDPGLILPQLLQTVPKKKYLIGVVPHYVDKRYKGLKTLCSRYPTQVKMIDVQRNPIPVLKEIAECEYILSSSLHGLVVADALGIPNAWLVLSDKVMGDGFKFRDYYSVFGCSYEPTSITGNEELQQLADITHMPSPKVASVQAELDRLFQDLSRLFR
jgi:pyruvyltransferase